MRPADGGDPAHWERLESLYLAASGLSAAERAAYLDVECSGNDALRREVAELLACSPQAASFFDRFGDVVHAAIAQPAPHTADPLVGTMVGQYRIDARLGAGATGTVYRAYDVQLQRGVALKLLSGHLAADDGARKRFLTEARAAAALDHPNICTIHGTGQTDLGVPYIAMALCSGETLKVKVARGRLAPADAVSLAVQIARGLAAAHARGITHRDVKPANVMIGEDGLAKLVDFGLAQLADATVTASGFARGTFAYMAPELLRGQQADARSDLWSFGVVLYEMLTGRRPFRADSDAALLYTIAHERPEPIEHVQPDVPPELCAVVDRLLHENPNLRYHDARDVVADLDQLDGSASQTAPAGRPARHWQTGTQTRESKRWIGAIAGGVVVVVMSMLALRDSATLATDRASLPPRVAVMFFHDDTQDRSGSRIAGALTSQLIDALAQVPGLDVPSLNAMQPYRQRAVAIPVVAQGLGAAWLIGGFVERIGDRLRVTAELSDSTGRRLDFRRVEMGPDQASALIAETVEAVAIMLRARVGDAIRERRWQAGTRSDRALALLRQARERVNDADSLVQRTQPRVALEELFRADDALARAAGADPNWPEPLIERAWVARELAYVMFGLRVSGDSLRNALDSGVRYANTALELNENAAGAYEVRGVLRHAASLLLAVDADTIVRARLLAGAEQDLEAAVERDNTLARAFHMLSMIQSARGDFEQARLTTERAYRADYYFQAPDLVFRLFSTAFETGQDEEAAKWCALIRRRFAESWFGAYCRLTLMTWSPAERADADTAWRMVAQATATTPIAVRRMIGPQLEVLAAGVVARAVPGDSAERTLARIRTHAAKAQLDPNSLLVLTSFEAGVRVRLGQTDSAVALLRRYLAERPDQRNRLANSRIFNKLFADPRLSADAAVR